MLNLNANVKLLEEEWLSIHGSGQISIDSWSVECLRITKSMHTVDVGHRWFYINSHLLDVMDSFFRPRPTQTNNPSKRSTEYNEPGVCA